MFDSEALKKILKDADYLFHIAGVVKAKDEKEYYQGNVETTRVLLDVLCEVNSNIQKVVIVSSQTACGPSVDGKPVTEETPEHPITRYGKSKLAQEQLAKKYMNKLPIKVVDPTEQQSIISLVDKILTFSKRLNEIGDKRTDERAKIEEEIKKTDAEIDALVYEIYGITDAEKKIIEDNLK